MDMGIRVQKDIRNIKHPFIKLLTGLNFNL